MFIYRPASETNPGKAPHSILAPGDWKNEPNEQWYEPRSPQSDKK
jgi:hypothetical protein